jgi:hypothetical protein
MDFSAGDAAEEGKLGRILLKGERWYIIPVEFNPAGPDSILNSELALCEKRVFSLSEEE